MSARRARARRRIRAKRTYQELASLDQADFLQAKSIMDEGLEEQIAASARSEKKECFGFVGISPEVMAQAAQMQKNRRQFRPHDDGHDSEIVLASLLPMDCTRREATVGSVARSPYNVKLRWIMPSMRRQCSATTWSPIRVGAG